MKIAILPAYIFVAFLLLTGCTGGGGDPVTFKFNMAQGSKFSYSVVTDVNMNQSVMGKDMKLASKIITAYTFEVTADNAGFKTVKATISKIAMKIDANGMAMNIDSDLPTTDTTGPMAKVGKVFAGIKGGEFYFTINENGDVSKVTGMDEMIEKTLPGVAAEDTAFAKQTLAQAFNDHSFKDNLQHSFAVYPGKPVKPGESWTKTYTMDISNTPMKVDNTFTLESVTGNVAKIKVVSKLSLGGALPAPGMQMDITGDIKGINNFDLQSGMPLDGDNTVEINAKMKMQGQEIPMKITEKINTEGKKL